MPLGISQDGPLNVKRTLGSFVPHPANIGKVAGAHLGITAPRMHLANGGRGGSPQNTDITSNMFQPLNASGSNVPNADVNFISSPALAVGPGPGKSQAPTPTQQPSEIQDFNQTAAGATNLVGAANAVTPAYNAAAQYLSGANPNIVGGIASGLAGNGYGGILGGPNAQSANALMGTNSFAPGVSLDTLGGATSAVAPAATDLGTSIAASAAPAAIADAGATAGLSNLAATSASSLLPSWLTAALAALADGGAVPGYAGGGEVDSITNSLMRREAGETFHPSGLLNSAGPGRTDTINTNVPAGAYVIPADVVSGLGEGNTLAGSAVIDRMFSTQPHGIQARPIPRGRGAAHVPAPAPINPSSEPASVDTQFINSAGAYANGGKTNIGKAPVVVAGGEHVLSPEQIINKFGSLKKGHKTLDHWVVLTRRKIAKEMMSLPNPVGSKVKI